jgi:CRP-like cAMP-binding protein
MNAKSMTCNQTAEMMGRLGLLAGLSAECLLRLASGARHFSVEREVWLFHKGDAATELLLVVGGQVKALLPLANGTEKMVGLLGPGESLGAAAVVLGESQAISAVSKTTSHILAISRETLLRQAGQDAALSNRLLTAVARRVFSLLHDLETCAPRSSLQRVSCFLLRQRPDSLAGQYNIVLSSTKREMAAHLNLAQETLSRVFQQLTAENAIEVRGRLVRVLDSEKLLAINLAQCPAGADIPEQSTQLV